MVDRFSGSSRNTGGRDEKKQISACLSCLRCGYFPRAECTPVAKQGKRIERPLSDVPTGFVVHHAHVVFHEYHPLPAMESEAKTGRPQ